MLSSPIDRNNEPRPEKEVTRISSSFRTVSAEEEEGASPDVRSPHPSEGVILRMRGTRMMQRRKTPCLPKPGKQERRIRERRGKVDLRSDVRWNVESQRMLIIALERKIGKQELWQPGDRVSVVPQTQTASPRPQGNPHPSIETQNIEPSYSSEGVILRMRGTRMMQRRKMPCLPRPGKQERRVLERRENFDRRSGSRGDAGNHHILIVTLERKVVKQEPWKTGDRVSVVPRTRTASSRPQDTPHPSTETQKSKPSLLFRSEEDYVLHLKSYLDGH